MILLPFPTNQSFFQTMIPLTLYLHIPWCLRKCPYCDFNSHKSPTTLPENDYVKALIADLTEDLQFFSSAAALTSIFIGGGTPSLFSAQAYEILFSNLQQLIPFSPGIEITLEANPGTVEQQRFRDYRTLGINRLSLGIQSFNPRHLKALGRIHDDTQAHQAVKTARNAGFDNINLDIMHGLPNQSITEGLDDLSTALAYEPEHLSWYQLTIEPNTIFHKKPPILPNDDDAFALEEQGFVLLNEYGLHRYEISAFSKPQRQSQHNLNYWLFGDYLGIGAGAHGKFTSEQGLIYRTRKHRQPKDYLETDKPFLAAREVVSPENLIFEFMLNTSRLQQRIPLSLFGDRTNLSLDYLLPKLKQARLKGLITLDETSWQVTDLGRRYTNDLQGFFLPET
jgi:putative oxygen-independent coproporphyrinogen III oxidase